MIVRTFPKCCGAGVLIIEHLTGKGKEADMELIKSWVAYSKRNGYRMYDFPQEFGGTRGDYMSAKAVIGGPGDQKSGTSWGMLLAITTPGMKEAESRLIEFGFEKLMTTHNPIMSHKINLLGLDLNKVTSTMLEPAKPVTAGK